MTKLMPSDVRARYKFVLEALYNNLRAETPRLSGFSELHHNGKLSKRQFYEILKAMEESDYIKRVEVEGNPYYILWKWGFLVVESDTVGKITALDWVYLLEGSK
jgi:DNA-binding Lrp family transcriptional regulator